MMNTFFFFKQKTAYEMRISDWSSDVCCSDLPTHGPHMNFHEYQAKQLFADYGIAVPAGRVARTPEEAVDAAKAIGGDFWVVKAQIHAGGRGKAGGVKLDHTLDEVRGYAKGMIGQTMETYQSAGDRKSTRLNSSHSCASRMPSS